MAQTIEAQMGIRRGCNSKNLLLAAVRLVQPYSVATPIVVNIACQSVLASKLPLPTFAHSWTLEYNAVRYNHSRQRHRTRSVIPSKSQSSKSTGSNI